MGKRRADTSGGLLDLPSPYARKTLRPQKQSRGLLARLIINSSALYVLYWILYACPQGVPGKDSPQVCHRYYDAKHIVATKAIPVLQPYYEQYASPYVSKGLPYYHQANSIYRQYAKPVVNKSGSLYTSYVHPVALKSSSIAKKSYESKLAPTVNKHVHRVSTLSRTKYDQYVGKHVADVKSKYDKLLSPYVTQASHKGQQAYNSIIVPAYYKALPYGRAAASHASALYVAHIHPRLLHAMNWFSEWLETKVFPVIRRLYYLHVEPQLSKVSDKFFQLTASAGFASLDKTSVAAVESAVSSSVLSGVTLSTSTETTVIAGETLTVEASAPTVNAKLKTKIQHGIIDDLLSIAENNIAKEGAAAEKALLEQLDDTLPALVKKEEILCEDYLKQLEKVTVDEVGSIEQQIISFAKSDSNRGRSTTELAEELRPYFIKSGKTIHAQAVEVKAHIATVLESLQTKVKRSTFVVYEQVLAEAQRQKREPEQKLRYELEGVTKKELKRLNSLDDQVKTIEQHLNSASAKVLKHYTQALTVLLDGTEKKVESLAGGAANKLHTLRNIGPKKITVLDDSEEFGHGYLPVGMMLGAQAVYNQISVGMYGAPEPTPELHEQILFSIKSFATGLPKDINTDSIIAAAKSAASLATEQGANAAAAVSSVIADIDTDALAQSASSAASIASLHGASALAAAEKAQGYLAEHAADLADGASSAIYGTPPSFTERVASKVSAAMHGTEAPLAESLLGRAHDAYEAASEKLDSVVHGTPVPLTKSLASKASEVLYGSETPVAESIKHRVVDAYEDIKEKASDFVHGTEEEISEAAKAAKKSSSSLASVAARSSSSLASVASKSSASLSASAKTASLLASKSMASASSLASRSSASLASLASSASSLASKSASSVSSVAARSAASAQSAAKSISSEESPVIQSVVDKAWEDYANAKEAVAEVIDNVREHIEL